MISPSSQNANIATSVPIGTVHGMEVGCNIKEDPLPPKNESDELEEWKEKKHARAVNWAFTYNGINQLNKILLDNAINNYNVEGTTIIYAGYSIEKGEKNGTIHAQGFLVMSKKSYWNVINEKFNELIGFKGVFSVMKKSLKANEFYCSKSSTHIEGPFIFGEKPKYERGKRTDLEDIKEKIKEEGLTKEVKESTVYMKYPNWCKELELDNMKEKNKKKVLETFDLKNLDPIFLIWEKLIVEQDWRKILWIYDPEGENDKTKFVKYMISKHGAFLGANGRSCDIMQAYNNEDIVMLDFSRSEEEKINYTILEKMKNGFIHKTKYQSTSIMRTPIKLCVMANFEPDLTKLSKDRWQRIYNINGEWVPMDTLEPKIKPKNKVNEKLLKLLEK